MSWAQFLAASIVSAPLLAQAPVPMHQEPRHRLVLETPEFLVMDIQIPPGDTTLYHTHSVAVLYTAISTSPTNAQVSIGGAWGSTKAGDDPGWQTGDTRMDTSYAMRPLTHRVTNVGARLFRLIAVASLRPGGKGDVPALSLEVPGEAEERSGWFRQARLRLPAQTVTSWHTSSAPVVIVQPQAGTVEIETGAGPARQLSAPGTFATIPAGKRYRVRNVGPGPAIVVLIQVR